MKIKGLLIGMLACTALVGCTNEDELVVNNEKENQLKGDKAYVKINIANAESSFGRGANGGLSQSTTEHAIESAVFYFYSADGTYVTEGDDFWNGNGTDGSYTPTTAGNIEFKSNLVVTLTGLADKGTPKYLLVVLNSEKSLTGLSLADAQKVLLEAAESSTTVDPFGYTKTTKTTTNEGKTTSTDYFVMTNSTYNNTSEVSSTGYFATVIPEGSFLVESPTKENLAATNAVQVYVERLAAKATVSVAATATTLNDGKTGYKITNNVTETAGPVETDLYVKILGWDLNGTNKKSYLIKNVDETFESLGEFNWNAADDKRTFWGKSWNYGEGTYPADYLTTYKANNATDAENDLEGGTASAYTLDYIKWNEIKNTIDDNDYCAENTNTPEVLKTNFHSTLTEVLLKAEVVDQTGSTVDLVLYDNILYKPAGYYNRLFAKVNPNIYYKTSTDGTNEKGETITTDKFEQITLADVTPNWVNEGDGKVTVSFTLNSTRTGGTWGVGKDAAFTAITAGEENTTINNQFKALFDKEKQGEAGHVLAKHYNEGKMYYNIPIEHLRGGKYSFSDETGLITVNEADYGVVRNHWYKVNVTSITKLGNAVHDPDEDIIPNSKSNVTYYVGAQINILSWKVVTQDVEL